MFYQRIELKIMQIHKYRQKGFQTNRSESNIFSKCQGIYRCRSLSTLSREEFKAAITAPIPKECGVLELTILRKSNLLTKLIPKFYLYDLSESLFLLGTQRKILAKTVSLLEDLNLNFIVKLSLQ